MKFRLDNYFDRIVCLCVDHRVVNNEIEIVQQIRDIGGSPQLFIAGDGKLLLEREYSHIDVDVPGRKQAYNYAVCFQKIIKQAKEDGVNTILFLEDDAILTRKFNDIFPVAMQEIAQNNICWSRLCLGGNHVNGNIWKVPNTRYLIKTAYSLDLHASAFQRHSFDTLLGINPSQSHTLDGMIGEWQKNGVLPTYAVHPTIISQLANFSYNEGRLVNRAENYWL